MLSHLVILVPRAECVKIFNACPQLVLHKLGLLVEMSLGESLRPWQGVLTKLMLIKRCNLRPFNKELFIEEWVKLQEAVWPGEAPRF